MTLSDMFFDTVYDVSACGFFYQSEGFGAEHVHCVLRWSQDLAFDVLVQCRAVDGGTFALRSKRRFDSREAAERSLARFLQLVRSPVARSAAAAVAL